MKTKFYFYLAAIVFSLNAFAQNDVLIDETFFTSNLGTNELVKSLDKGINIENGLFFTKSVYKENVSDKRDLLIVKDKKALSKIFEIEISKSGSYFFAAHVLPANNGEKISLSKSLEKEKAVNILDVRVFINGKLIGTLKQTKLEWELVPLNESQTISLQAGKNIVRFESDVPYYPMVDGVRITQSEKDLIIENKAYDAFVSQLRSNSSRVLPVKKETQEEVERAVKTLSESNDSPQLRSAMHPGSYDWQVNPQTLSCPACTYNHKMNVPITFTYYRKLSLSAGTYTFHTTPTGTDTYYSVDPVMYLYKIDNPHSYSYYNDDYDGLHPRITASLPAGDYYLVIRAYSSSYSYSALGRQGLVNVYQNSSLLNSNAPVSGYMFDISSSNTGLLNYFTAYSTGIPVFWLQENSSKKIKFKGETFFYASPMDYYWFDDARMRLQKNSSETYSMLVSAEGAMGFYFGNCDAYGSAKSDMMAYTDGYGRTRHLVGDAFPNLKAADAIQSAPMNGLYNCTAWAGGFTNGWVWHIENQTYLPIQHNGTLQIWNTWDDYFGNNPLRYNGATTYTNDQAYSSNGEIAMWSTNGAFNGVTHASVRLAANNHPHGYDWESKAGGLYRFFHPRDALNDSSYGNIFTYYRDINKSPYQYYYSPAYSANSNDAERNAIVAMRSTRSDFDKPIFTMEESIEKGLTVIEEVQLDADQMNLVRSKSPKLRKGSMLQTLYENWLIKIKSPEMSYVSNPYSFIETKEGFLLLDYARKNMQESIVFFANVVFEKEEASFEKYIAEHLFCEIARDKYTDIMEKIKDEWKENNYDQSGRYIAPMPETFAKKYIKKLLDKEVLKKNEILEATEKTVDNHSLAHVYPNPVDDIASVSLNLSQKSLVTVKIYNQSSLIETLIAGRTLGAGTHSFAINAGKLSKGLYMCLIEIDGVPYSRKFLKR